MVTLWIGWFLMSAFNVVYGFLRARQMGFVGDAYWQGVFTAGVVSLVVAGVAGFGVAIGAIH